MITFPNAKINIGLNIIGKRDDGFHNIESVMYPIGLCDALEIIGNKEPGAEQFIFTSSGIDIPGNAKDNLCRKAYDLISRDYALPNVRVHLHKHIPVGAGLGGGSADAAFFIRLLNEKFEIGLAWGEMHHYSRQLGSDCSFFISNKPAFAEEKGDQFESVLLDLSGYYIVLVCPPIHVNTAKAYSGVKPQKPVRSLEEDIQKLPAAQWKDHIYNDFEDSIFSQFPEIKKIKESLYEKGALYASMSGSGSSVYGLFERPVFLETDFPGCFVYESEL
ncbi:MAG: 4-(cytidine 5'-diphospho)-2-C-methyl-D-erythritol kinase [Bacteroidia bacterium]